jgi:hypothetical protein
LAFYTEGSHLQVFKNNKKLCTKTKNSLVFLVVFKSVRKLVRIRKNVRN